MSKPWGGVGAWAAEAEREEAEERARAAATPTESQSFPSLKEAVSAKPKKKKMTLSEFTMGDYASDPRQRTSRVSESKGLTPEEMLRLPTCPKERSPEEMQFGRLGGGFSSYGRYRDREDTDGSWGGSGGGRRSYGGFDDERRAPPSRVSDFDQPSRADEVDNWAMSKKTLPTFESGRQNRYGSLGSGGGIGGVDSRADDVDNWISGKKPLPSRSSTFGSGFSRDLEPERWSKGSGLREGERERPRLVLDPPKGDSGSNDTPVVKTNKPNPFGVARPREEVLAEMGLDWKKLDSKIEAKRTSSGPTSAQSSRSSSAQSNRSESIGSQGIENVVKPKPKLNPFGDAKPREVLLAERGKDWRKIDLELEHRGVDRPETEEEKKLKEEIDQLKTELEKESTSAGEPAEESCGEQSSLHDIIIKKERELEKLNRDFDDKIRFGQKAVERPGSGAGRTGSFLDRVPSASSGESRNLEFMDRPRSRGTGDQWPRHADERRGFQGGGERGFQGGGERGFLGSRDLDRRPRSRERW